MNQSDVAAAVERLENLRQTRHLTLTPIEQEEVWSYINTVLAALREAQGEVEILDAVRKEWMDANEILGHPPDGPLCEMERQRDTARTENAAQAKEIKRLREALALAVKPHHHSCCCARCCERYAAFSEALKESSHE